jgi:hypothetical protein
VFAVGLCHTESTTDMEPRAGSSEEGGIAVMSRADEDSRGHGTPSRAHLPLDADSEFAGTFPLRLADLRNQPRQVILATETARIQKDMDHAR